MLVCKHFVFVGVGKKSAYLQLFPIIEEKETHILKLCKKFKIFSSSAILISFVSNICCTHPICSTEHSIKCLPHIFRRTTNIHLNRSHKIPGLRTSANWFVINILTYWTCKCTDIKPSIDLCSHNHISEVISFLLTAWKKQQIGKKGGCEVSSSDSHSNVYTTKTQISYYGSQISVYAVELIHAYKSSHLN